MEIVGLLLPFVLLGIAVLFVAFSGGPGRARDIYLTRGGRGFRLAVPIIYVIGGLLVPALVLANREASGGSTDTLKTAELSAKEEEGKQLFQQSCKSCHDLDAVNARGVTGPDLDEIGEVTPRRIVQAIENGGTGQQRMPARILRGEDAEAVGAYVARVAGK